jgi:hypothetical protein
MPGDLLIRNARVVLPDHVLREADVRVRNGNVVQVSGDVLEPAGEPILDADGARLLPGLIDVHCDTVEKEVQPRPGVCLPFDLALAELDRKLALCGVTTIFHGVSFGAGEGVRSNETAAALVRAIAAFGRRRALVRHQAVAVALAQTVSVRRPPRRRRCRANRLVLAARAWRPPPVSPSRPWRRARGFAAPPSASASPGRSPPAERVGEPRP